MSLSALFLAQCFMLCLSKASLISSSTWSIWNFGANLLASPLMWKLRGSLNLLLNLAGVYSVVKALGASDLLLVCHIWLLHSFLGSLDAVSGRPLFRGSLWWKFWTISTWSTSLRKTWSGLYYYFLGKFERIVFCQRVQSNLGEDGALCMGKSESAFLWYSHWSWEFQADLALVPWRCGFSRHSFRFANAYSSFCSAYRRNVP